MLSFLSEDPPFVPPDGVSSDSQDPNFDQNADSYLGQLHQDQSVRGSSLEDVAAATTPEVDADVLNSLVALPIDERESYREELCQAFSAIDALVSGNPNAQFDYLAEEYAPASAVPALEAAYELTSENFSSQDSPCEQLNLSDWLLKTLEEFFCS